MNSCDSTNDSNQAFFIYYMKKIPFDLAVFNSVSRYFSGNQNRNNYNIDLIREFDGNIILSEKAINDFINFCQNKQITIDNENVILLHKLSNKFLVPILHEQTEQYILINHNDIISDFLSNFSLEHFTEEHEEIIYKYLTDFVQNDLLLTLPIVILYRILIRYKSNMETIKVPTEIKNFLFKCLIKFNREASILFNIFDLENENNIDISYQLLNDQYSDIFDFHYLNQKYLTNDYDVQNEIIKNNLMIKKMQNDQLQMLLLQIEEMRNEINQIKNSINDSIQPLKDDLDQNKEKVLQIESSLDEKLQPLKDDLNENKEKVQSIESSLDEKLQPIKDDLNESKEKVQSIESSLDEKLQPIKDDLNESKEKVQSIEISLDEKLQPLKDDLNESKEKVQSIEISLDNKLQPLKDELNENKEKVQSIESSLDEKLQPLKDDLNESKDVLQPLKNDLNQSKENIQRVETAFNNKMDLLKDEIKQIDTKKQQIKAYEHVEHSESQLYQLKIVMFNILSTKFFDKSDNIDTFNNLKGESQAFIFDSIYGQSNSNIILKKIRDLLEYLSKENRRINYKFSNESYIYIHLNDNCKNVFEINDIETVGITWNAIEMLYYNFSFTSYDFLCLLRSFDEFRVEIEIKYPKSEWRYIYEYISRIKETNPNINISILISDIEKTDETFQSNSKIDSIKIYSNDKELECYDENDPIRPLLSSKSTNILINTISMNSFSLCTNLREVILSKSIKMIESRAFNECSSLTRITIPSSVIFVDEYAFNKCTNLSQITYDPYITKLHQNAFNECFSLNHLILYSSVVALTNFVCDRFNLKSLTVPSTVKFIAPFALSNFKNLTNFSFDQNLTRYTQYSFRDIESLNHFIFPSNEIAFQTPNSDLFKQVKEITIPNSVKSIGINAFMGCLSVEQIIIPSSVTFIEDNAFYNCLSLKEIEIPSSVVYIGNNVFSFCKSLTYVKIHSSVSFIGFKAFYICNSLKRVVINSPLEVIEYNTFSACSSLEEFDIPSTVRIIDKNAFSNCSSLKKIEFPPSLIQISSMAFQNCTSITQIKIPSSVNFIGDEAFAGCSSLRQIEIPSSLNKVGRNWIPQRIKVIKY